MITTNNENLNSVLEHVIDFNEISFWAGAGISFNSGIPSVINIIKCVIKCLSDSEEIATSYYEKYKLKKLPFEVFMQTVIQFSNDDQLLEIFERGQPNKNHDLIAQLCTKEKVKEIYTTNFDTLIENSLVKNGLVQNKDFSIYNNEFSYKKGIERKTLDNKLIKIFKIHGSIDDKKTIRTSIDTIAKQNWMRERNKIVKHAFGSNSERLLIVLGYSFSDVFDIIPAIETIKQKSGQTIFIVMHDENISSPEIVDFSDFKFDEFNLSNFNGKVIRIFTDTFIEFLAKKLNLTLKGITKNLVWRNKIQKWTERLLTSHKEYILSELFFLIHDNLEAQKWNDKALEKAHIIHYSKTEIDIILQKIKILHQIGENENIDRAKEACKLALNKSIFLNYYSGISQALQLLAQIAMYNEDDFIYARKLFQYSLNYKEKIKDLDGQAVIWLSLSSCLRHEQKHNDAIKACKKSISIRKKTGDIRGIAKCFQGLGNIYLELAKYQIARKKYLQFEKLTSKIGDTWANATANYTLADINCTIGSSKDLGSSLNYCNKCLEVRQHNKNREYANAIYLKGKILYKLGFVEEASKLHEEAYNLRINMPNKSDLADSSYEIGKITLNESNYSSGLDKIEYAIEIYLNKGYSIQLQEIRQYLSRIRTKIKLYNVTNLIKKIDDFILTKKIS